jgi:D-lactate dehydrogenase (cytochrome)
VKDTVAYPVEPDYVEYLRDESRLQGEAEAISFPGNEQEVRQVLAGLNASGTPATVQGARTGISGGAVPFEGHILNLSRMDRVLGLRRDGDRFLLRVQPGVLLVKINEALHRKDFVSEYWDRNSKEALAAFQQAGVYFFPPDPTETTATMGGMAANNASGARSFFYGQTRQHIEGLRVVLPDGSAAALRRGRQKSSGHHFRLHIEGGKILEGELPTYTLPQVKNVAGYYVQEDMDLIDLFIGSEGTLGVITELELILAPYPQVVWGIMCFFAEESQAVCFLCRLRGRAQAAAGELHGATLRSAEPVDAAPAETACQQVALEFFDSHALKLLREQKEGNPAFAELPAAPQDQGAAIYVEYHGKDEEQIEDQVFSMAELMVKCGGDEDSTWMATNTGELERLKSYRHALPEAVNLLIDERRKENPGLMKLGTDMAVPDSALEQILALYNRDLEASGLEYVKFGHIGNNHIHVNILPRSLEDYDLGRSLYTRWADAVIDLGGTISAEHGIGKLKKDLLVKMFSPEAIRQMQALRQIFNPKDLLNRGNSV